MNFNLTVNQFKLEGGSQMRIQKNMESVITRNVEVVEPSGVPSRLSPFMRFYCLSVSIV